ncbi:MAG: type VI secretion system baseplate subunit TssG, partial [Aquabacterium sp.]|nr:type VI secretion system baseplate subunit TssG [Aquabacterium sp.]
MHAIQAPLRSAIDHLLAEPHRHGFMQAVRLLERWQVRATGLAPYEVLTHKLRFRNGLSLSFPASEIAEFRVVGSEPPAPGGRAGFSRIEITPAFMGL